MRFALLTGSFFLLCNLGCATAHEILDACHIPGQPCRHTNEKRIKISADGELMVDNKHCTLSELQDEFRPPLAIIETEPTTRHETVQVVLKELKRHGVNDVVFTYGAMH